MRALPLCLALFFSLACAPADRDVRLERLDAERRNLEATFDHLEDRLMVNQARVRFWREMRSRHESVTAIACASQEEHALEMAINAMPRDVRSALHRKRVAAMGGPDTDAGPVERVPAAVARGGGSR